MKTKYFKVIHNPDLTEGRGHRSCTYFKVEGFSSEGDALNAVEGHMLARYNGERTGYVQGVLNAPMDNFKIPVDITHWQYYAKPDPGKLGDYLRSAEYVELSAKEKIEEAEEVVSSLGEEATTLHLRIESFIQTVRDSFPTAVVVYTKGSCIQLGLILLNVFPQGEIYYDHNHAITKIGDRYYDITGQVLPNEHHSPLMDLPANRAAKLFKLRFGEDNQLI